MTDSSDLDAEAGVDGYIKAWNVTADQRIAAVEAAFTADGYYCDGVSEVTGPAAIATMIDSTHEQFPGATIERTSPVDAHHQQARFDWRLHDRDGATIVDGIDVVRFDDGGKLAEVLGFFGIAVPGRATPSQLASEGNQ